MNELALQLAQELLSARDVATLLKLTPRAVRLRMAQVAPMEQDGIQVWSLDQFPRDYQDQLLFLRKKTGAWMIRDVVEMTVSRWSPDFKLATLPEYSQKKAFKVRTVMLAYDAALEKGQSEHEARCLARSTWLATPIVMSDGEVLVEGCSDKTITRWIKRLSQRGNIEHLPIEAFADRKSCPHVNQRREHRKKRRIPGELIVAFRAQAVLPDMNLMASYRKLEMDWQCGREVPGIGRMAEPGQPFPFSYKQLLAFKPSKAARDLGNKGNAKARRDSLPHITRSHGDLRPCEIYFMDDTRINVVAWNDVTGRPVELKCYIAMEVASRRIVGWVIREGSMKATDVDALMARVMATSGIAHRDAGYKTLFIFERGTVACSPAKQVFIEAAFPGQVEITRTSMNGGQNFAGDYVQKASGHWMGKGVIESFMRTLHGICRHIAGQRGSVYQEAPAVVGDPNKPHAGGLVDESIQLIQAARGVAMLKSDGTELAPNALQSVEALDLKVPLLHVSKFRQAFAQAITHYNATTGHRREGFRLIPVEKENGGLTYRAESSDERWRYLLHLAEQHGKSPQRISAADVSMLLHKGTQVTITQQGAEIQIDNRKYRYWHQDSIACAEAMQLSTVKKQYVALYDPGDLSRIYLLRNAPGKWQEGDASQFLECLPLYVKPGANDKKALGVAFEESRQVHNRVTAELVAITAEHMKERTDEREANTSKLHGVVTTTGDYHEVASLSALGKAMNRKRREEAEKRAASESRHLVTQTAQEKLLASLAENPETA